MKGDDVVERTVRTSASSKHAKPRYALPLGRLTKRTPTHTPVPPNPTVEPLAVMLAVSFLNSFFR